MLQVQPARALGQRVPTRALARSSIRSGWCMCVSGGVVAGAVGGRARGSCGCISSLLVMVIMAHAKVRPDIGSTHQNCIARVKLSTNRKQPGTPGFFSIDVAYRFTAVSLYLQYPRHCDAIA